MFKFIYWAIGALVTIVSVLLALVFEMAATPAPEAKSNLETWLNIIGFDPLWAKAKEVDSVVVTVCLVLLLASFFAIVAILVQRRKSKSSPAFDILFDQGNEPFLSSSSNHFICRFGIVNNSNTVLNNLQVKIHEVTPTPEPIYSGIRFVFPYNLRFQHDAGTQESTSKFTFNTHETLHKNDKIFVDVLECQIIDKKDSSRIEILSVNTNDHLGLCLKAYDLKILVSSDNGGSGFFNFRFNPLNEEKDMWVKLDK